MRARPLKAGGAQNPEMPESELNPPSAPSPRGAACRAPFASTLMLAIAAALCAAVPASAAKAPIPLQVAYAGSMGALMEGPVSRAVLSAMDARFHGRAQGSLALAHLIAGGSISPDVFISVTPAPMRIVLAAGKAARATPFARTEMVIAYSPNSRFAAALAKSGQPGAEPWYDVLSQPGLRFGRTDPNADPLGRNTLFMMDLAARHYGIKDLSLRVLGEPINRSQIFAEPELMARLQAGQLDAAAAYETQPPPMGLPFIRLPAAINLGDAAMEPEYRKVSITIAGKTLRPQPLVFYAAVLKHAAHPEPAAHFVDWLLSPQAQAILKRFHYDSPGGAPPLTP